MEEKRSEKRRRFNPLGLFVVLLVIFWYVIISLIMGGCVQFKNVKEAELILEFFIDDGTAGYESSALENPVVEMQEGFEDLESDHEVLDGYDPDWISQNLFGVFDVYSFDVESPRIAVLDGGFQVHDDLDLSKLYDTWSFVWDRENVFSSGSFDHGLAVTSVIGSIAGNGRYMAGVPIEWCLYEIAWGSSAFVSEDDLANAVYRAVENDCDLIIMAWGGYGWRGVLAESLRFAYDSGVVLVAASGNDGKLLYPGGWDTVISVGASDMANASAGGCYLKGKTRVLSGSGSRDAMGTSFSAPAAGLILSLESYEDVYDWYRLSGYDPGYLDDSGVILAVTDEFGNEVYRVDGVKNGYVYKYRDGWDIWVLVDRDRNGFMSIGDILGTGECGSRVLMKSVWRVEK